MNNNNKITETHLQRNAYIYIRQSTDHQAKKNIESTERQYELVKLASELSWPKESIIIIDEDQAHTASTSVGRTGFARLASEVAQNNVGIILGIEVSRVARNNTDWYQLLDFCALTNTLIGDTDGIYDPSLYNDRLLLGLKGTMSEAELHILKNRMLEALYHKAQKGELKIHLPIGLQYDDDNIIKSVDEQIVHMIDLTFKKFFEIKSIHGILKYYIEQKLLFPRKRVNEKKVRWVQPTYYAIRDTINNPLYTGTYVYGRSKVVKQLDENGKPVSRVKKNSMDDWKVIIHDHHPGYISWTQYLQIQKQIKKNKIPPKNEATHVVREGSALLQGLVVCGYCGRSMHVQYHGQGKNYYPYYVCNRINKENKNGCYQSIGGRKIEDAVTELFLETVSCSSLNIHLKALDQIKNQQDLALEQLKLQLESAQYNASRAFRQFDNVEPENRLVARNLEKKWNKLLQRVNELNVMITNREKEIKHQLSKIEEKQIKQLAQNLPALWNSTTTTNRDRKMLLQAIVQEVQLKKIERDVTVKIVWSGDGVIEKKVHLPKIISKRHTSTDVVELVRQLAQKFTDDQIARILMRKGLKTATGLSFNGRKVAYIRANNDIPCYKKPKDETVKFYTAEQAATILKVSVPTIHKWITDGFIKGEQMTSGAPWEIILTDDEIKCLTAQDSPEGWLSLTLAAKEFGVTKQTILNWIKSHKVEYIYVTKGNKKGLRINIKSNCRRNQLTIFDKNSKQKQGSI